MPSHEPFPCDYPISQAKVNGFSFNMGHLKALNYPDYQDKLSADNPVSGYLKKGTIRHSLVKGREGKVEE